MKILVLSDSHGTITNMLRAMELERPTHVIHLGDYSRDAEALCRQYPMTPVAMVRGNCDYAGSDVPEQRLAEYGGVRILMCHGHRYGVKSGLLRYSMAARENQVDVALFGHTHSAFCEEADGVWLLNPGSCGMFGPTYGLIEIRGGKAACCVKTMD